jgi:hypothetical protein
MNFLAKILVKFTKSSLEVESEFDALLDTDALLPYRLTMLCVVATETEASKQPITILVSFESRSANIKKIRLVLMNKLRKNTMDINMETTECFGAFSNRF